MSKVAKAGGMVDMAVDKEDTEDTVHLASSNFHSTRVQRNDHHLSRLSTSALPQNALMSMPPRQRRQDKQPGANILYLGVKSLLGTVAARELDGNGSAARIAVVGKYLGHWMPALVFRSIRKVLHLHPPLVDTSWTLLWLLVDDSRICSDAKTSASQRLWFSAAVIEPV